MGTGGLATIAHGGYLLAGLDGLALADEGAVDVTVDGDCPVGVPDADPQAEAAGWPCLDDDSVGCGDDRCADPVGDVDAPVHGAPACAVGGGEPADGGCDE